MADDVGKLILRLTVGVLMLLHGISKLTRGVSGIEKMLEGVGMPSYFAFGAYVGEVIAPILVIIGFYSRVGAVLIVFSMLFAVGLAHRADLFLLGRSGGWALELQAFFLLTALALAFMGPGRYSINRR
ncbi:MAG: DoxX family protein [Betaproteobacteria bacterium]